MQDFQSIPGLTGRIFTGNTATAGSDNRRLRSYPSAQPQPPVKCPRCDSSNTKFCYYNNYNLSQPRHFCKSCRRYWTKGGVLRNVPVGGGCRKTSKRSSSSKSSSKSDKDRRRPSSGSGSSSDSSSLTASASASNPNPKPNPNPDPILDPVGMGPEMFPEAGSFTSFMAAAAEAGPGILGFNFPDPNPTAFRIPDPQPEQKVEETGIMDQTVPMDLPPFQGKSSGGGLTGMDWPPAAVDSSFFDLSSSVDPAVYWNQSHWGDTDPSLYLP